MARLLDTERLAAVFKRCNEGTAAERNAAKNEFFAILRPHVFFVALHVLSTMPPTNSRHHAAEDLASEALGRLHKHFSSLDPRRVDTILSWFWTVMSRILIDQARTSNTRPKESLQATYSVEPQVSDGTRLQEQRLPLLEAMKKLSNSHREILVCVYWGDLEIAKAAALLKIPEGTAKSRLYYALRALRKVLEETYSPHELLELAA